MPAMPGRLNTVPAGLIAFYGTDMKPRQSHPWDIASIVSQGVDMSFAQSSIIEPASGRPADACVIFLHGQGGSGYDFEPLFHALALPDSSAVRFVLPGAPMRQLECRQGARASAWYDAAPGEIAGGHAQQQMVDAVRQVEMRIDSALADGIDASRIILGGFGQGADIAAHAALGYRKGLGGLMMLSTALGTMPSNTHDANRHLLITMHHGRQDPVVGEAAARQRAEQFIRMGYSVDYHAHTMGNEFCADELSQLRAWLVTRLIRTRLVA